MNRDTSKWLEDQGLGKFADLFAEHEVDMDVLPELGEPDLEKIGVPLGPRKKLLKAIAAVSTEIEEQTEVTGVKPSTHSTQDAERRHLTVMFVDFVGSTEMATKIDAEDMRDVITG